MRGTGNESHLLHSFTLKKQNQVEPCVIFITKIELFGLNEKSIEEARLKVKKKEEVKNKVGMY